MPGKPRLYTDWRRPSRGRSQRLLLLALMLALTAAALWLFGGDLTYGGWP